MRYWKQNGVEVDNIKTVYKALNILKDEMGVKIEYNYAKKGYQLTEQLIQLIKSECEKRMPDCSGILINLIELSTNLN